MKNSAITLRLSTEDKKHLKVLAKIENKSISELLLKSAFQMEELKNMSAASATSQTPEERKKLSNSFNAFLTRVSWTEKELNLRASLIGV